MKRIKLKIARIQKDLSQKELADRIKVSSQTISDYEAGRSKPSYNIMKKISRELNCTVDELFFNNEEES